MQSYPTIENELQIQIYYVNTYNYQTFVFSDFQWKKNKQTKVSKSYLFPTKNK